MGSDRSNQGAIQGRSMGRLRLVRWTPTVHRRVLRGWMRRPHVRGLSDPSPAAPGEAPGSVPGGEVDARPGEVPVLWRRNRMAEEPGDREERPDVRRSQPVPLQVLPPGEGLEQEGRRRAVRNGGPVEVVESDAPAGLGVQGRVYFVGPKKNGSGTIVAFNPLDAPTVKVYEPPHHVMIVPAGAKPASQSAGGSATAPQAQASPRASPASTPPAASAGSGGGPERLPNAGQRQ